MLVGRSAELALLSERVSRSEAVALVGEAGVGKTALLREVARTSGRDTYEGGGLRTLSWAPYLPLARALGSEIPDGDHAGIAAFVSETVDGGVLLVDDLHWADGDTLGALELCASRISILTAVRRGDPAAADVIARLEGAGFALMGLDGLTDGDATNVVRTRRPTLPEPEVARIVEAAHGNPLMLEELASGDSSTGPIALSLGARLQPHSREAKEAIARLALLGRPAGRELLDDGVDELLEAGLVVTGPDGLEPRHALLGEMAVDRLEAEEVRRLHGLLASRLEDPGEAARHLAAAGDAELAHDKALEAAEQARWPAERARHLALAATQARPGDQRDRLRVRASAALNDAGEYEPARQLVSEVASEDRELCAAASLQLGRALDFLGNPSDADAEFAAGLALVGASGSETEVRLRLERARCALFNEWGDDAGRFVPEAWELAQTVGVADAEVRFLLALAELSRASPRALEHGLAAVEGARASGDDSLEARASGVLVSSYEAFGDPEEGHRLALRMVDWARERRLGALEAEFRVRCVHFDLLQTGSFERAIAESEALLEQPKLLAHLLPYLLYDYALALAMVGRLTEAAHMLDGWLTEMDVPVAKQLILWGRSEVAWFAGSPAVSMQAAEEALAIETSSPNVHLIKRTLAWAALEAGQQPSPLPDLDRDEEAGGMTELARTEVEALARMAAPDGAGEAAQLFEKLARRWAKYELPSELRCLWAAGESWRRAGERDRARRCLEEAERRTQALGMAPLLGRVQGSLRRMGVRRAAPRRQGAGPLSAREREVLDLVGQGLTSAEIAARLGVAPSTVDSQVKSAMAKLRVRSRRQAALIAAGGDQ